MHRLVSLMKCYSGNAGNRLLRIIVAYSCTDGSVFYRSSVELQQCTLFIIVRFVLRIMMNKLNACNDALGASVVQW